MRPISDTKAGSIQRRWPLACGRPGAAFAGRPAPWHGMQDALRPLRGDEAPAVEWDLLLTELVEVEQERVKGQRRNFTRIAEKLEKSGKESKKSAGSRSPIYWGDAP